MPALYSRGLIGNTHYIPGSACANEHLIGGVGLAECVVSRPRGGFHFHWVGKENSCKRSLAASGGAVVAAPGLTSKFSAGRKRCE